MVEVLFVMVKALFFMMDVAGLAAEVAVAVVVAEAL